MVSAKELESARSGKQREFHSYGFHLPRQLNLDEKKYLLSVERGNLSYVRRMLLTAGKLGVGVFFPGDIDLCLCACAVR